MVKIYKSNKGTNKQTLQNINTINAEAIEKMKKKICDIYGSIAFMTLENSAEVL